MSGVLIMPPDVAQADLWDLTLVARGGGGGLPRWTMTPLARLLPFHDRMRVSISANKRHGRAMRVADLIIAQPGTFLFARLSDGAWSILHPISTHLNYI